MKKNQLILFSLLFFVLSPALYGQAFDWAKGFIDEEHLSARSIAADSAGNTYITGDFMNPFDFDPGPGTYYLTSEGFGDIYLCRLSPEGSFVWARSFGGSDNDIPQDVQVDNKGYVYVIGGFKTTVDFDPGPGSFELTSGSGNYYDIFISKFDTAGNFITAFQFRGEQPISSYGISLHISEDGSLYSAGYFGGTVDFDPGPAEHKLTASGYDAFVCKLGPDGQFGWVKQFTGSGWNECRSVKTDTTGNVYIAGSFKNTVDMDPGPGTYSLTAEAQNDIFIAKLNPAGELLWAKQVSGSSYDDAYALDLDASGNVYTTGRFYGTNDFDPGPGTYILSAAGYSRGFILKLSTEGDFVWAGEFPCIASSVGYDLEVAGNGDVYSVGTFEINGDLAPDSGYYTLTNASGTRDVYISKIDSDGFFTWAKQLKGDELQYTPRMAMDHAGNVYTMAGFRKTVDMDPGPESYPITSMYGIYNNVYVQKLAVCHVTDTLLKAFSCESSFTLPWGPEVTEDGTFYQIIPNSRGCDSVITYTVRVNASTYASFSDSACYRYTSPSGEVWSSSGTYQDTIPNTWGCDSVMTIHLTILENSYSDLTATACDSYISPGGKVWTSSGAYQDTIPNASGCDSVISIDLTILSSSYSTHTETACDSYLSPAGDTLTAPGTYYDTLVNKAGCDSVITINLTVNASSYSSVSETACSSYTSPGSHIWTVSGTYSDTLTNQAGCDSIITIQLTMSCQDGLPWFGESPVSVYPNPSSGKITVDLGPEPMNFTLSLFSSRGDLIRQSRYEHMRQAELELDASPGLYIIELVTDTKGRYSFRLVKY